ncbi:MAG: rhodanese-like domain-containing protein [Defluviitaleaceae bacterium]|nr:rhodanese-like domain-containing protein [Defluviitaleaceae bacterium]
MDPTPADRRISPAQAREWMDEYPDAVILDVRTMSEFSAGHIRGAVLLPVDEIEYKADEMLGDKDALILIYCRSGVRSQTAAWKLIYMGYTRVYDFGGIIDWPYGQE